MPFACVCFVIVPPVFVCMGLCACLYVFVCLVVYVFVCELYTCVCCCCLRTSLNSVLFVMCVARLFVVVAVCWSVFGGGGGALLVV